MSTTPPWEIWEIEVQDRLGLRSTIASGNKFYDPSDGVDKRDHTESDYLLMVDAKCTEGISYRFTKRMMSQGVEKARQMGYRFALPVRLENGGEEGSVETTDYVVTTFDDFLELVESYRKLEDLRIKAKSQKKTKKRILNEDDQQFLDKIVKALNPAGRTRLLEILKKIDKA